MSRWLLVAFVLFPLVASAADQEVLGVQFVLKNPSAPERRTLSIKAKDSDGDTTLVGDVLANGAILTVRTTGGTPGEQAFHLPGGTSQLTGKPFWRGNAIKGFRYQDSRGENGAIKKAQIKLKGGDVQIQISAAGRIRAIDLIPPNPGSGACVLLEIGGGDSYSVQFADGRFANAGSALFKITKPLGRGSCLPEPPAEPLTPPMAFHPPVAVQAGGASLNLGIKAVPRLVDWNDDGVLDLLVFAGDGYVWRHLASSPGVFGSGTRVKDVTLADIRVGTAYTGGAFADLDDDGRPDLAIAGNTDQVRLYRNAGTATAPAFATGVTLPNGSGGVFMLAAGTFARIDVVDWDGDGLLDLLAGNFDGSLRFHRNVGTATTPAFASTGVAITKAGTAIAEPHNTHPRAVDVNADGILDLVYGLNWHYFQFCPRDSASSNDVPACFPAADLAETAFNLRDQNGDDSCPDFADVDGDGVLDLIDGGLYGKVVLLRGRPALDALQAAETIMAAHPSDLGSALLSDPALRVELFRLHHLVRRFVAQMKPGLEARLQIRDGYEAHIEAYEHYLRWRRLDENVDAFVPLLAGQCWVNLFESMPDTAEHRSDVAEACGFDDLQADLLTQTGTIFVENHRAKYDQQRVLRDLQLSLPEPYRVVELVTIAEWLYPAVVPPPLPGLSARTGVNVFSMDVGSSQEGFPPDVPSVLTDTYSIAIAHELNHNVEAPAGKLFPNWYWQRKSELLKQAAPPHYEWTTNPVDGTHSWNPAATKQTFLANGYWDGVEAHWPAALNAYWSTGPGAGYERHWCRDNLRLSIEAPQEAFATLANQYFNSSETMLQLGLVRFANGNPYCLNQVLFFAEVYAAGGPATSFYRVDTMGNVTRTLVPIQRGPNDHIEGITAPDGTQYEFEIATNGDVLSVQP